MESNHFLHLCNFDQSCACKLLRPPDEVPWRKCRVRSFREISKLEASWTPENIPPRPSTSLGTSGGCGLLRAWQAMAAWRCNLCRKGCLYLVETRCNKVGQSWSVLERSPEQSWQIGSLTVISIEIFGMFFPSWITFIMFISDHLKEAQATQL